MSDAASDRRAVRASFSRAAKRYAGAAAFQRRVCRDLVASLPPVRFARILDLGCGTGFATADVFARWPSAHLYAADAAHGMLCAHEAPEMARRICTDAHALPFADHSFDLVLSSLMIQWCDIDRVLEECARVLVPGGWLAFSTVLDGTLREVRQAFAATDDYRHVLRFLDETALRAAVSGGDWADASVTLCSEVEYFVDARALLQSNRDIGASRVLGSRSRAFLDRRVLSAVLARLEAGRTALGLPLSYELGYVLARTRAPFREVK